MKNGSTVLERTGNPVWGFWATLAWSVLIGAVFIAVQTLVVGAYVNIGDATKGYDAALMDGDVLSAATIASAFVCTGLVLLAVRLRRGGRPGSYLALRGVSGKSILVWTGLFIVLLVALDLLTSVLDRPVTPDVMREIYQSTDSKLLLFVGVVFAAAIFEEIFFRGFLLEGLRRSAMGNWPSVILTAALWSLVHLQYDVYGMASIFAIGVFLGAVRMGTGSTLLAIALHALNNALAFLFLMLTT
ncbi:CPBP family intramembrane glutamic endopeptidase [Gilvimarinus sp. F26214L]|uniref:lysostaphin resistance A-like protein n=1 Tax=Gilvimarinus sp. DZF01 TaxID=3461371 RepID=UPI004045AEC5